MSRRIQRQIAVTGLVLPLFFPVQGRGQGTCLTVPSPPGGTFDAAGVELLGWVTLQDFNEMRASDLWAYVSPSGREYALIGLHESFAFVEVTDPSAPVIVAQIPGPTSCWRDIKVFGHYAYGVVDDTGEGMYIFDLARIDDGVVTLAAISDLGEGFTESHNIAMNMDSGFAYLCISNVSFFGVGLVAVDLSDPLNPTVAGRWADGAPALVRAHDAQIVTYTEGPYAGREIAFCFTEEEAVWIVDATDKSNMFTLSSVGYPTVSYCHQGWLTEDRRYLFVDDELDEEDGLVGTTTTYVFDVQDLANPQLVSTFTTGLPSSDHNLMVRGPFVYEANYASGLRVFDIGAIDDIAEAGFFDTYPENDDVGAGPIGTGAWGVYTALPSRSILVSDRNRGLFVLDASGLECGDGQIEPGENCDPGIPEGQPGACPTTCDDADPCTLEELLDAGTCLARCDRTTITETIDGDGCCPAGANAGTDSDCPPACGNTICEPDEDVFTCPDDCPCADDAQCDDGDICTRDRCLGGACSIVDNRYGDTNHDGSVDIVDIFCVLDGFQNVFRDCSFVDVDIADCAPDQVIDILDIFAVLDAFQSIDNCCAGGG